MTWDMGTGKKSRGGFAVQEHGSGATFSGLLVEFEVKTIYSWSGCFYEAVVRWVEKELRE